MPTTSGVTIGGALAQRVALEIGDLETGGGDRLHCWTVAVATVAEPRLESVQPVLPSGKALTVGAYVLDEHQAAAGLEQPVEFAKRSRLVVDRAQDEGGDRLVWLGQRERPA